MRALFAAILAAAMLCAAPDPVAWSASGAPTAPVKAGGRFSIKLAAKIQEGWHLYSMRQLAEGPIATRIWIAEGQPFSLAGAISAAEPRTLHDASFGMEVELYEGEAVFTLPVRIATAAPAGPQKLVVNASYQTCDNRICLPPKTVKVEVPVMIVK